MKPALQVLPAADVQLSLNVQGVLRSFDHKSFAVSCPPALLGTAFYPVLVNRHAASLHASSARSVALSQLRFAWFVVINSREDLHLQECAHAGRT